MLINKAKQQDIKMQSSLTLSSPLPTTSAPLFFITTPPKFVTAALNASRFSSIRSNSLAVNYNSPVSVFPAEACETVGGDACMAEMNPEVKLKPEAHERKTVSEPVEREYLDYTDSKTVLLGEACDVLGGEFCEAEFQRGIS